MWKLATEIIKSVFFVLFKTENTKSYYFSFKKKVYIIIINLYKLYTSNRLILLGVDGSS